MLIHRIILFFMLIAMCNSGQITAQNSSGSWKIDQKPLVNWSRDAYWYPATIIKKEGNRYFVLFDDGDKEWTDHSRMTPDDIAVGDRVFGNWKGKGKYYPGKIATRNGTTIHIKYDDGDQETTTISFVRVKKP